MVVLCVSGVAVAMLSPRWGRYGNSKSAPCLEVLIQTSLEELISTLQQFQGCKLALNNDSHLGNTASS